MSKWIQAEGMSSNVRVLDMAAGRYVAGCLPFAHSSGEVTEALLEWEKSHRQSRSGTTMTPGNSRAFIPPNARRSTAPAALRLPDNFNLDIVATDPVRPRVASVSFAHDFAVHHLSLYSPHSTTVLSPLIRGSCQRRHTSHRHAAVSYLGPRHLLLRVTLGSVRI
jgi:hypothetical protein